MGLIGNITAKIKAAATPKANPEAERRRLEDEREKDLYHRQRMLRAEELADARVSAEVKAARRGKPQQAGAQPARKDWGTAGLEHMGFGGGGSGSKGRNPLMEGLSGHGGGGGGFGALIGYDEPRSRKAPQQKKKKSHGGKGNTTIIIKK